MVSQSKALPAEPSSKLPALASTASLSRAPPGSTAAGPQASPAGAGLLGNVARGQAPLASPLLLSGPGSLSNSRSSSPDFGKKLFIAANLVLATKEQGQNGKGSQEGSQAVTRPGSHLK
jgi:hypothetical protein